MNSSVLEWAVIKNPSYTAPLFNFGAEALCCSWISDGAPRWLGSSNYVEQKSPTVFPESGECDYLTRQLLFPPSQSGSLRRTHRFRAAPWKRHNKSIQQRRRVSAGVCRNPPGRWRAVKCFCSVKQLRRGKKDLHRSQKKVLKNLCVCFFGLDWVATGERSQKMWRSLRPPMTGWYACAAGNPPAPFVRPVYSSLSHFVCCFCFY